MPGLTPNENILKALDEIIKAINDRGITEPPVINVTCPTPVINVTCGGCGGGCGGSGTEYPEAPITEPETPEDPPAYFSRKCNAANWVLDGIENSVTQMVNHRVMQYATAGGTAALEVLSLIFIGAGVGMFLGPFGAITGAAVGAVAGLAIAIAGGTVDFSVIQDITQNNRAELVCVLYSSTDAQSAKTALLDKMYEFGITSAEYALLDALLQIKHFNALFGPIDTPGAEDEIQSYEGADCSACEEDEPQDFLGWQIPTKTEALDLEYPNLASIADLAADDLVGQYSDPDGFPGPRNTIIAAMQLISPEFTVDTTPATIVFTVEGGGDGSPNADQQWHYFTYTEAGGWTASLANVGNGTHTITTNDTSVTQAAITYYDPFIIRSPLGHVSDIQYTNLTVTV